MEAYSKMRTVAILKVRRTNDAESGDVPIIV